jgi:TM2 domain-containing membrane protein YozV
MKNRITAALLAFFLGGIGIHKFYLGENAAGVFYLIFSCTFIPGIIAIFDFIGLLLTTDQAFNAKYNTQQLQQGYGAPVELVRDKAAALGELKKLYDGDVITAEEFEAKRQKILDSI